MSEFYFVYFAQEDGLHGETGHPVKIGHAFSPWSRVCELQTGNPRRIRLKRYLVCSSRDEARLLEARWQRCFAHLRIRGEWFHSAADLCTAINNIPIWRWLDEMVGE